MLSNVNVIGQYIPENGDVIVWPREFDGLQIRFQIVDKFTKKRIVPTEFLTADGCPDDVVNSRRDIWMRIVSSTFSSLSIQMGKVRTHLNFI